VQPWSDFEPRKNFDGLALDCYRAMMQPADGVGDGTMCFGASCSGSELTYTGLMQAAMWEQ
jgi:hypothetical protein